MMIHASQILDVYAPLDYALYTVKALQHIAKERGLGLTNLRDYKRDELTAVLLENDKYFRDKVKLQSALDRINAKQTPTVEPVTVPVDDEIIAGHPIRCYESTTDDVASWDRYTVVYMDQPEHSGLLGSVGLSGHSAAQEGQHLGKRIAFISLPGHLQNIVRADFIEDAYAPTKVPRYAIQAGRGIVRDGMMVAHLSPIENTVGTRYAIPPAELDKLARHIVALLNYAEWNGLQDLDA